ncbi:unnamed protein product [Caenorhabditis nigoni]
MVSNLQFPKDYMLRHVFNSDGYNRANMPPVALNVFLNSRCPGWQSRSVDVVNRRLQHLGRYPKIVNDDDDESVYSLTPVFTDLQSALICFAVAYSIVVVLGLLIRDVEWESDTCDFKLKKFDQNVRTLLEDQESSAKIVKDTLLRRANSLPNLSFVWTLDQFNQFVKLEEPKELQRCQLVQNRWLFLRTKTSFLSSRNTPCSRLRLSSFGRLLARFRYFPIFVN